MKRNFLKRGAAMAMAGMLAMSAFLAVPALPASATAAETEITAETETAAETETTAEPETAAAETDTTDPAVIDDGAMREEQSGDLNGELNSEAGGLGNDDVEMPASENNEETDAAGAVRSGEGALTGTIGDPDADGNVLEWSYDEGSQTLTITGSGVLVGSNQLLTGALSSMEIRKIEFQDCKVTGSMADAFSERDDLKEIDFSGLDTSSVTDMSFMFDGCSSLESLDISSFNTRNVTDMAYMFINCSSLRSLDLRSFDTRNVTDMSLMFWGCSSLESLDISRFNTSNVTDMILMFHNCSSLRSLDLSSFDTRSVIDMEHMFAGCSNLGSLDLSGFDTGSVTSMASMFDGCSSLGSLDLSGFDTRSVTDMGYMFKGCSSLGSLDLSGFDTRSVTDMKFMFSGCSSLGGLDLGSFDTSSVTSMRYMFYGCSSLGSLDLGSFDTSSVTDMESMFRDCSGLNSLELSNFDTSSVTDMGVMFCGCSGLGSLDLGSFDTSSVTSMGHMFYGCSSLGSLDLGSFDTSSVTDMGYMFFGCSNLSSLELSNFDTSSVTDMGWMFCGCSGLGSLDLGSFDTSSVTNMISMFTGCSALATLHTPYNVKVSASLPAISNAVWCLPDGTQVTELPQNLSSSVLITRNPIITTTTEALNMPDVIRVKYVPYSYTVQTNNTDPDNQVTFSVIEGRLAEGLQMYPVTGEIYGVPLEAGEFNITVQASYSNPKYPVAYAELKLIVLENTDSNVGTATDPGYDITQPVPNTNASALSVAGTQLLVSEGEYAEFQDAVYLDGRRLQSGTEYTSEAGSTRVTIQNQTLADAGAGTHTLSLEFRTQDGDLRRAAQNLVISDVGDTGSGGTTDNGGNASSTDDNADDGQDVASVSSTVTVIDYIVQPGDTLWRISGKFFGDSSHWRQIYADNMDVLRNPDRLRVGQHLKIYLTAGNGAGGMITVPAMAASGIGGSYVVQPGDNLWRIAGKVYGKSTRWREIYEANRDALPDPKQIYPKQMLIIP